MSELVTSSYLAHLPAAFRTQPTATAEGQPLPPEPNDPFLGRFLLAFEQILSGLRQPLGGVEPPSGIEERLDQLARYFVPMPSPLVPGGQEAPRTFLPWLAGWLGVSLRGDWNEQQRRRLLQRVPALYRGRGTLACMTELLTIYLAPFGATPRVGETNVPHYFVVSFALNTRDEDQIALVERGVRAIVDQDKPAHTYYGLDIALPAMKLPIVVGVTSLLGSEPYTGKAR